MKKLIQKWLGITDLQDRDKKLGDILVPYHVETDKILRQLNIRLSKLEKNCSLNRINASLEIDDRIKK